jgi:predicted secreted protein
MGIIAANSSFVLKPSDPNSKVYCKNAQGQQVATWTLAGCNTYNYSVTNCGTTTIAPPCSTTIVNVANKATCPVTLYCFDFGKEHNMGIIAANSSFVLKPSDPNSKVYCKNAQGQQVATWTLAGCNTYNYSVTNCGTTPTPSCTLKAVAAKATCTTTGYVPTFTITGNTNGVKITMGTWYVNLAAGVSAYTMPKEVIGNATFGFSDIKNTACATTVNTTSAQFCNIDPCAGVGTTIYSDCSYGGKAVNLTAGTYTISQLAALGMTDNVISSLKVNSGYSVIMFTDNNFSGASQSFTVADHCLIDNNFNDAISSIKVMCGTTTTCNLTTNITNIRCDNKGTATNAADDVFYFDVTATGSGTAGFDVWAVDRSKKYNWQNYGQTATNIGPFPISGGAVTLSIYDATGTTCFKKITVTPPTTCSNTPLANGSIGDQLFVDVNNDGIFNAGDTPVVGAKVTLLDGNGAVIGSAISDANGKYLFGNLPAGSYIVRFPTELANGSTLIAPDKGTDDAADSDANQTTGTSTKINLAAGQNNLTVDAGYAAPKPLTGSIGDQLFVDMKKDGIFNAGDLPVIGAKVSLLDGNGNIIGSATTDINGKYLFTNLPAGSYIVRFPVTLADGSTLIAPNTGTDTTVDSDANLTTGTSTKINLAAGQNNLTIDAGYSKIVTPIAPLTGSIGDQLFIDVKKDGIFNAGDTPVAGAKVSLLDGNGNIIGSSTTDVNGKYLFAGLPAGSYIVRFPVTLADGSTLIAPNAGTDATIDSDANQTTGTSTKIVLLAGQNNLTIDAGYNKVATTPIVPITGSIGDQVFFDTNNNGIFDAGDKPLANISVTISDGSGNAISKIFTDITGKYLFSGLTLGTYSIGFPAVLTDGTPIKSSPKQQITISATNPNDLTADAAYYKAQPTVTYCAANSAAAFNTWIERVQFGAIDKTDYKKHTYEDLTATSTSVAPNTNATITLTGAKTFSTKAITFFWTVYIDFNKDGDFADAGEEVVRQNTAQTVVSAIINIPANATTGATRMRVVMQDSAYATACGTVTAGAVKDFTVNIDPTAIVIRSAELFRIEGTLENEVVNLTWYNNTGKSNEHFEVERSIDGGKTFTSILRENNRNTASKVEIFKAKDAQPVEGNNTYRLVTYMQDGIINYSETTTVTFRQPAAIEIYPNPADDYATIQLGKVKNATNIDLFDNAGRLVRTVTVNGEQTIRMDNLESGFYTVIVRTQAGTVATKKLAVNRNY